MPMPWSTSCERAGFLCRQSLSHSVRRVLPSNSPKEERVFNFCVASTAFDTRFTEENLTIAIEKLLYDGEDIFCSATPILPVAILKIICFNVLHYDIANIVPFPLKHHNGMLRFSKLNK